MKLVMKHFRNKIILFVSLLVVTNGLLYLGLQQGFEAECNQIGYEAGSAAASIANVIAKDYANDLIVVCKTRGVTTPEYVRFHSLMSNYKKVLGYKYVYTFYFLDDGKLVQYVVDADDMASTSYVSPNYSDKVIPGHPYDVLYRTHAIFQVGHQIYKDDKWGYLISSFAMINVPQSPYQCFVGVDVDKKYVETRIYPIEINWIRLFWFLNILFCGLFLYGMYVMIRERFGFGRRCGDAGPIFTKRDLDRIDPRRFISEFKYSSREVERIEDYKAGCGENGECDLINPEEMMKK